MGGAGAGLSEVTEVLARMALVEPVISEKVAARREEREPQLQAEVVVRRNAAEHCFGVDGRCIKDLSMRDLNRLQRHGRMATLAVQPEEKGEQAAGEATAATEEEKIELEERRAVDALQGHLFAGCCFFLNSMGSAELITPGPCVFAICVSGPPENAAV